MSTTSRGSSMNWLWYVLGALVLLLLLAWLLGLFSNDDAAVATDAAVSEEGAAVEGAVTDDAATGTAPAGDAATGGAATDAAD